MKRLAQAIFIGSPGYHHKCSSEQTRCSRFLICAWNGHLIAAAATHDTTITLDERHLTLTHRIDKFVDRERSTVVNDLASAGCVAGIGLVPRLKAVRLPGSGKPSVTDGDAALLFLNDCGGSQLAKLDMQRLQRRRFTLAMRRFFLADRQYLWRNNLYYWAYRASRSLYERKSRNAYDIQ